MAITDASGNIVQRYTYETFGQLTASDPTFDNIYTYTGREYDKETGLYYYRARYYDAMEGRFISKDPIGFAGGDVNLYNYVGGNPINYVDPSGLFVVAGLGTANGGGIAMGDVAAGTTLIADKPAHLAIGSVSGGPQLGLSGGGGVLFSMADTPADLAGRTADLHIRLILAEITISVPIDECNNLLSLKNSSLMFEGGKGFTLGFGIGTSRTAVRDAIAPNLNNIDIPLMP